MLELFEQYTNQFDKMDKDILIKYYHSFRVMELCRLLAIKEKWNNHDQKLASIIGLLHDYGRFPQLREFHTYEDYKSLDHGSLGVQILFDEHQIEPYGIPKEDYNIVYQAIKNHNQLEIDPIIEGSELLFSKLIRDADKIDIIYIVSDYEQGGEINPKVHEAFMKHKTSRREEHKSKNDLLINTLCLVYDINFISSFQYLKDNRLIERFKKKMNNPIFDEYCNQILIYIEKRLKEC